MGDNLMPKSADTIDTLLHHDISSQNNTTSNVDLLQLVHMVTMGLHMVTI